ncbi:MAG: polymerase subunit epsilon [Bacteriovoracaceae bacterium]|nr:polymerase subunit epsilon [Bacteriovoracaceae bacterium]
MSDGSLTFEIFSLDDLAKIPETAGVYNFIGEDGEILYVGKSIHLKRRVQEHLSTSRETYRAKRMQNLVRQISICRTGSELIALLLESHQIKTLTPIFNRAQRRSVFPWGLYEFVNDGDYKTLSLSRIKIEEEPVVVFGNAGEGKKYLDRIIEKYTLCPKLCGLEKWTRSCFSYQVKRCLGACLSEEESSAYNARIKKWMSAIRFRVNHFWMIDRGRTKNEWSVAIVENGIYNGFGYFRGALKDLKPDLNALSWFQAYPDNKDVQRILRAYHDRAVKVLPAKINQRSDQRVV